MYADPAGIFLSENLISQKKNAFLADFAAGLSKIIKQNLSGGCLEGGPVPLRLLLRSRRLSSNFQRAGAEAGPGNREQEWRRLYQPPCDAKPVGKVALPEAGSEGIASPRQIRSGNNHPITL